MRKKSKAGRPPFKPTPALRRKVAIAAGAGMAHEDIATGLGIVRNTLEKHFKTELSQGAMEKRMEVIEAMRIAAKKGNVAAQKAYIGLSSRGGESAMAPKGKKEQAQADATGAESGTEWDGLLPKNVTRIRRSAG